MSGVLCLDGCVVQTTNLAGTTMVPGVSNLAVVATSTLFEGVLSGQDAVGESDTAIFICSDCDWYASKDALLIAGTHWDGGTMNNTADNVTLTLSGAGIYMRMATGVVTSLAGSGTTTISVPTSAAVDCAFNSAANPVSLSIASGATSARCAGTFLSLTSAGTNGARSFTGTVTSVADITGPAFVDLRVSLTTGKSCTIRGKGVRGALHLAEGANPQLDMKSATDCLIEVDVVSTSLGQKAYALDSASTRNLLIVGGLKHSNYTTASTNAGTLNRIITPDGDSFVAPGSGAGFDATLNAVHSGIHRFPAPRPDQVDFAQSFLLFGG